MRALLVAAPAFLFLTACIGDNLGSVERVGLVAVRAFENSGTPVVRASAVFYRLQGLQISPAQTQDCALFSFNPAGPGNNAGATITAGASVSFTVGAFSEVASPAENAVFPVYNFAVGSYLDFVSGDSVLVSVPGADGGFDAVSVKARLAEPFTADPLPPVVENMPLNLSWQAASTPGSIMVVSLRYNAAMDATLPNVEIVCAFDDDGSAQIPTGFADAYRNSSAASRQHVFIRVRDRIVEFDGNTRTRVRSIFEYPTTSLLDAP